MVDAPSNPSAETGRAEAAAHQQPFIPEQVRRQMAEADQIRADIERGNQVPPAAGGEAPPAAAPPSQAAPPPSAPPTEDDQSWEQRYNSMKGRFEATQRSNQQMADRLQQLENSFSAMQARGAEPPAAPPQPAQRPTLVTDQERTDYGDELLGVMGKRAREEVAPEFEELSARLKRLESGQQAVSQVIDRTERQTVFGTLSEHVPNWKEINHAPEFHGWLAQLDPFSGRQRKDMLTEAFDRHESGRVLAFFQSFLTEATGTPPTPSSPGNSAPPLAPNGNGSGNRPTLEDFAAPGRARSAPQNLPPDKPIYTSAWIAKFMADKRTGKYRGREADADAIERDIYQAQHEGRIQ